MRLVWDASALISMIRTADVNHQAAYDVWDNHKDDVSIFPAIAWFEYQATVSRLEREGQKAVRSMYLLDEKNIMLPIDTGFVRRCAEKKLEQRFEKLRGADLVYACAAALENASLVTFDTRLRENVPGVECLP